MKVYRVRNIDTGEYLKTRRGKTIWMGPGHAKNGWYAELGGWNRPKWSEQTDWEIVECEIVPGLVVG